MGGNGNINESLLREFNIEYSDFKDRLPLREDVIYDNLIENYDYLKNKLKMGTDRYSDYMTAQLGVLRGLTLVTKFYHDSITEKKNRLHLNNEDIF